LSIANTDLRCVLTIFIGVANSQLPID
jgi:hypothetical protein